MENIEMSCFDYDIFENFEQFVNEEIVFSQPKSNVSVHSRETTQELTEYEDEISLLQATIIEKKTNNYLKNKIILIEKELSKELPRQQMLNFIKYDLISSIKNKDEEFFTKLNLDKDNEFKTIFFLDNNRNQKPAGKKKQPRSATPRLTKPKNK
jgi:hypothetical protein